MFVPPKGLPATIPLSPLEYMTFSAITHVLQGEKTTVLSSVRVGLAIAITAMRRCGSFTDMLPMTLDDIYAVAVVRGDDEDEDEDDE